MTIAAVSPRERNDVAEEETVRSLSPASRLTSFRLFSLSVPRGTRT